MSFVSGEFLVLFLAVFAVRVAIGRRTDSRLYIGVLIAAGLLFYAWHVPYYLLILLASTSVDYVAALALARLPGPERTRRRLVLAVSLGTNLGLLGFFKYGDLLLDAAGGSARLAGFDPGLPLWRIVLPIGISFYTFEAMSYTIDVYRGVMEPIRSFPRFVLFICFFPHLVAGPIVRAWQFVPQLSRRRRLRLVVVYEGVWLLVCGYFLKTVCADNLGAYVNAYWSDAYAPGAGPIVAGGLAVMFAGQIFADFAGYSNIARGLAYLLGYRLPLNFNAPYLAATFRNFWERWHITLSRWLRDYLYVPLGGNRLSARRTYINLLVVMTLGGLWHGAAVTFIVWGALHGAALAVERALGLHRGSRPAVIRAAWFVCVQIVVLVGWVFFRSDSLDHARAFLANMFAGPSLMPPWARAGILFLSPIVAMHLWAWLEERRVVSSRFVAGRVVAIVVMVWTIAALHGRPSTFIYFQF